MDDDWCHSSSSDLIKDDCLFSAVCSLAANELNYFDCGPTDCTDTEGSHYHIPSATVETTSEATGAIISTAGSRCLSGNGILLDNPMTPTAALEQHLNLEIADIFDIKSEPHDDYPNVSVTQSLSPGSCCSSSSNEFHVKGVSQSARNRPVSSLPPSYANDRVYSQSILPPVTQFSHSTVAQTATTNDMNKNDEFSPLSASERSSPEEAIFCMSHAKTRSKMHEMAVRQKLITDQDPRGYGFLQLSAEEKRTLLQEGYTLPTKLPLTRSEEEALKVVRRKIKNKLSAQESRRKRKEYLDALEHKVQCYFTENTTLRMKMKHLEQNNRNLLMQLRKLQALVGLHSSAAEHPSCPTPNVTAIS